MKSTFFIFSLFLIILGCDNSNTDVSNEQLSDTVRMEKPETLGMDQDSLNAQVQQQGISELDKEASKLIDEAKSAIKSIYEALEAIRKGDKDSVIIALESLTGKLEILLA